SVGYLLDASKSCSARLAPAIAMLGLLALGVSKVAIGFSRGRPVEFLIFACAAVLFTALAMLISPRRSLAGDRLIASLQSQRADLKSVAPGSTCPGYQVTLGAALF